VLFDEVSADKLEGKVLRLTAAHLLGAIRLNRWKRVKGIIAERKYKSA